MGYRLYVRKKGESTKNEWCGGKVYGYEGVGYYGAVFLYKINEEFREEVDFYHYDIKDLHEKLRDYFECEPRPEIEISGVEFLLFLKFYRADAQHDFKYFEPIDLKEIYVLRWF